MNTSRVGLHTYMVTAVSKDGLTGSASIGYTVVPAPRPPDSPEEPPLRIDLSLSIERESLPKLLRTRKLVVAARVNEPAKVALSGSAELKVPARREARTRFVAVFKRKMVSFVGPGEKKVTLVLSRKGREALRRLPALRLAIAGKATDAAGETATSSAAMTLQR